jgi:hypothetical protein
MDKILMSRSIEYVAQVYEVEQWYGEDKHGITIVTDINRASPHSSIEHIQWFMNDYGIEKYHIIEIEETKTRRVVL